MKKNVIFIDSYLGDLYGAQRSMLHLSQQMHLNGNTVSVGSVKESKTSSEAKKIGLNIDPLSFNLMSLKPSGGKSKLEKLTIFIFAILNWFFLLKNYRILNRYENIIFNDIRLFIYLFPILPLIRNKVVWYVRIKETNWKINDFFSRFCKCIALVSSDCIGSFKNIRCQDVQVVNTGFDNVDDIAFKKTEGYLIVNSVGSLCQRKNQLEILKIFNRLTLLGFTKYKLNLIGDNVGNDTYKQELEKYLEDHPMLKENVSFLGFSENVQEELIKGDVFFFSSKREGLPRSVIEALKAGNYIISSEVEGIKDIITCDEHGYIYNDLHEDEILHIKNKLTSLDLFSESEKTIRIKYANSKFSNKNFVNSFIRCLR